MRVGFIGGTHYVGPASVPLLLEAGHEVVVAHSGEHEHPAVANVEHLHGSREDLLAAGGSLERWSPDVLVDTFANGATAEKSRQLGECAGRIGVRQVVAVSSMDVYEHCVHAGIADGTGIVSMPPEPFPLREDAPLRHRPYPGGSEDHDNVAMETELAGAERLTVLRPGAVYGPYARTRESYFVLLAREGVHQLPFPDRGQQIFHRVAVGRVGRAVVAALDRAPEGRWACNVVDPFDWNFAGLAGEVGRLLNWGWEPIETDFPDAEHPWATAHPILGSDERLREVLDVHEPDPRAALAETIDWLWQHRAELPPRMLS